MKKIVIVLIVALVVVASASAFTFKSVGLDVGGIGYFVTGDMVIDEVSKDFEVYARLGYTGNFAVGIGAQYKVADLEMKKNTLAVKPGLHMLFNIGKPFIFARLFGCEFSYDAGNLEGFLRPEMGMSFVKGGNGFAWAVEAGVAYLL